MASVEVEDRGLTLGYTCGALRVSLDDTRGSIGPRAHVSGFLNGLRRNGISPRVYLAGDDWMFRRLASDSTDSAPPSRRRALLTDAGRLALRPILQSRAGRALGRVDLVYERQSTFQDLGRKYQKSGVPWVIESNGPFWYEAAVERESLALASRAKVLEVSAYRDANLVVVVSEALKDIVMRESGRSARDVLVLPNATDAVRFDPGTVVPKRIAAGTAVGFCGYLTAWAGVDLLLRAVATLRSRGLPVEAVVIGDGPQKKELQTLAHELGLEKAAHFLGRLPWSEVPPLLAGLDVAYSGQRAMAIGSMYHSPQKLYEYQAMALPIVASDHDDARRTVAETGWLFQSDDLDDLVRVLAEAVEATDRKDRGLRARQALLQGHTWEERTAQLLAELRRRGLVSGAS